MRRIFHRKDSRILENSGAAIASAVEAARAADPWLCAFEEVQIGSPEGLLSQKAIRFDFDERQYELKRVKTEGGPASDRYELQVTSIGDGKELLRVAFVSHEDREAFAIMRGLMQEVEENVFEARKGFRNALWRSMKRDGLLPAHRDILREAVMSVSSVEQRDLTVFRVKVASEASSSGEEPTMLEELTEISWKDKKSGKEYRVGREPSRKEGREREYWLRAACPDGNMLCSIASHPDYAIFANTSSRHVPRKIFERLHSMVYPNDSEVAAVPSTSP